MERWRGGEVEREKTDKRDCGRMSDVVTRDW